MFVCSFIYGQSFYDIYFLNNMGDENLNSYYLEEANGTSLGNLYDELIKQKKSIEVVKEPISTDGIQEYEVYDTDDISISPVIPVSKEKKVSYLRLSKEDFADSTGKFKSDISYEQIQSISNKLNLTIKECDDNNISYFQAIKNNAVNLIILILISQFILLVYTFSRIKINAIKKLDGFSSLKMILDSFNEFLPMELLATGITILIHVAYFSFNKRLSITYFVGLIIAILIVWVFTIIQLLFTQISIRYININSMIKNQVYSSVWNNVMNVIKIVFIIAVTISISLLTNELKGYNKSLERIEGYRSLAKYYTSNGFNADEYDKLFADNDSIEKLSKAVKNLYDKYYSKSILIDANITNIASDSYYKIYKTNFNELNNSYKENYVVVNKNYYDKYMNFLDENGNRISISDSESVILVPQKYKQEKNVKQFCYEQYNSMMNYDCFYKGEQEKKFKDATIVYIRDEQTTPLLNEYLLETGEEIKNSIIFIDNGNFDGTWYLSELSNGKLAFELTDRDEYKMLLAEYEIDNLLSVGTLLTPLTEDIRYYEFLVYQSTVFVLLFVVTLFMIIFFSNYLEVMVNRKRYALKHLMGFSIIKNVKLQLIMELIVLILAIPLLVFKQNILIIILSVVLDIAILLIMIRHLIFNNVSEIMKGE